MIVWVCGFFSDIIFCKKYIDEFNNVNKVSCCFFFCGFENVCKGVFVLCFQCFFLVFDEIKIVYYIGIMICEGYLELVDKDVRIF